MTALLGTALVGYVLFSLALGVWVSRRVESAEDYLVAGRRLPLALSTATLLATWFGAGPMLTAADAVYRGGLARAALEPLGSGFCLILAGFVIARPLWSMRLLTVSDFFGRRFGRRAELLSAVLTLPTFFGWIAVQFVALAEILALFFGIPTGLGIALVAGVGVGYTLLGGMWSVALTDALQLVILLIGLVVLGVSALLHLGSGDALAAVDRLASELPAGFLEPIPSDTLERFAAWLGVFVIAALGNLSGQDLLQRIFAARSAEVAQRACWLAGGAYLVFGSIPVILGLCARVVWPEGQMSSVVPALGGALLSPAVTVTFVLALASAVLSTIDSAILAPASVLAQNLLRGPLEGRMTALARNRLAVVIVTAISLAVAYAGKDAYSLLEGAYAIGLVALFVPLLGGLYRRPRGEAPAIAAMIAGTALWGVHVALGAESLLGDGHGGPKVPIEIAAVIVGALAFVVAEARSRAPAGPRAGDGPPSAP
ncbi:MAG: sodium:solute symporter family protein [Nannocystaceae bacterium]